MVGRKYYAYQRWNGIWRSSGNIGLGFQNGNVQSIVLGESGWVHTLQLTSLMRMCEILVLRTVSSCRNAPEGPIGAMSQRRNPRMIKSPAALFEGGIWSLAKLSTTEEQQWHGRLLQPIILSVPHLRLSPSLSKWSRIYISQWGYLGLFFTFWLEPHFWWYHFKSTAWGASLHGPALSEHKSAFIYHPRLFWGYNE